MKKILAALLVSLLPALAFAQRSNESADIKQLRFYQDSLNHLGKRIINDPEELVRKNTNYQFIKTLVSALKTPNSFSFPFDSLKSITISTSPDKRFRIFSWHVLNDDGSYRFYGTIQMNSGRLQLYPFEDYSPLLKNPEDSVTDNHKWFGAQYYQIIPVSGNNPYYVLLGWKGNTVKSTKKVIEVLSFKNNEISLGLPVFEGNKKTRKRVVFEYSRQASMLLKYSADQNLIVFDHLSSPDGKPTAKPETFGPDMSYDGYRLKNGKWQYVENLDMRNIPDIHDQEPYADPKKQAEEARRQVPKRN
ncbi:hypothetical protein GCM10023149_08610 [Mucilaginibacter gynuensis]|uniref:Uncharacterized protein n=1 Tax=Mucilaginibacter gynuensis TaxID=1302236 RepID=A0ABP8FXK9_9SPHI